MVPTARGKGQGLAETLPRLMQLLQGTLATPEPFDPSESTRGFRLAAPDFVSSMIPDLLNVVAEDAPGVCVEWVTYSPAAVIDMRQERYDALIAPGFKQNDDLRGEVIGSWHCAVYGRKKHPAFANWSLASWARFPHLQIGTSAPSGTGPVDRAISRLGVERQFGAIVPQFSTAAPLLAGTNMLMMVPSVAMEGFRRVYNLERREVPFKLEPLELALFRSAYIGDQPEIRWFYERIAAAAEKLIEQK